MWQEIKKKSEEQNMNKKRTVALKKLLGTVTLEAKKLPESIADRRRNDGRISNQRGVY